MPFAAYQELVRELAAMKRDGFTPSYPGGEPAKVAALPAVVEGAIVALGVDTQTERHLRKQAWEMLRVGTAEELIVQRITEGEEAPL